MIVFKANVAQKNRISNSVLQGPTMNSNNNNNNNNMNQGNSNMQPNNLAQASQTRNFIKRNVRSLFGKEEMLDEENIKSTNIVDKLTSMPSLINHIQEDDRNEDFFDSYFIGKHEVYEHPTSASNMNNKKEKVKNEQINEEIEHNQELERLPSTDTNEKIESNNKEKETSQDELLNKQSFEKEVENMHVQISDITTTTDRSDIKKLNNESDDRITTNKETSEGQSEKEKSAVNLLGKLKNMHSNQVFSSSRINATKEENIEEPTDETQDKNNNIEKSEQEMSTNQQEKPSDLTSILDNDSEKTIYESFYELLDDDRESNKDPK